MSSPLDDARAFFRGELKTLDDDLQQPPEEIPRLLAKLAEGYDVVYGKPERERHGLWRNVGARIGKAALATATGGDVAPMVSAFRAFRSTVKPAFEEYRSPLFSIDVLLTWATTSFAAVPIRTEPRRSGGSNYRFRGLVRHAMNLMTGFSLLPLQLATLVGFAFTLFGMAVLTFVLEPGWHDGPDEGERVKEISGWDVAHCRLARSAQRPTRPGEWVIQTCPEIECARRGIHDVKRLT